MAESINAAIRRHQRLAKHHQDAMDRLLKEATWCPECQAYYRKDECGEKWKQTFKRGALISADCGYGDDDVLGDVTYNERWRTCPKGHEAKLLDRFTLKVENKHRRNW